LNKQNIKAGESIDCEVIVTNEGNHDGDEVVQLYIQDMGRTIRTT